MLRALDSVRGPRKNESRIGTPAMSRDDATRVSTRLVLAASENARTAHATTTATDPSAGT
jgi:hypothetical protein